MTRPPIKIVKGGAIDVSNGQCTLFGWTIELGGRNGSAADHVDEFALAALEFMTAEVKRRIKDKKLVHAVEPEPITLHTPAQEREAELMTYVVINQAQCGLSEDQP